MVGQPSSGVCYSFPPGASVLARLFEIQREPIDSPFHFPLKPTITGTKKDRSVSLPFTTSLPSDEDVKKWAVNWNLK